MHKFLEHETVPVEIRKDYRVCDLVEAMQNISFQGRNLFTAYNVWKSMLQDQVTVFLGLAGAMIPAGMRRVFVTLIRNRMVDCIVSTGANLFHDCHESLGRHHYVGSHLADDVVLRSEGVDRIYDTFASDKEFIKTDEFVIELGRKLADEGRSFTTPAFLYLLGRELLSRAKEPGILTTAAETGIPIFCPALPDSSIGIALAVLHKREGKTVRFDVVGDVWASTEIVLQNRRSGVVYIGGGTPKNFIQQIEVTAGFFDPTLPGHEYAVQITTDSPHWGGLSGCTLEEGQSWGKIAKSARKVTLFCDATVALPIIATALIQALGEETLKRPMPRFPAFKE